jgi:hypothetical protein
MVIFLRISYVAQIRTTLRVPGLLFVCVLRVFLAGTFTHLLKVIKFYDDNPRAVGVEVCDNVLAESRALLSLLVQNLSETVVRILLVNGAKTSAVQLSHDGGAHGEPVNR